MRQLLLLLAFLLPVCAYAQLNEPFDGPGVSTQNPWSGDVDCFSIEDGWLVSRADVTRKSASIFLPLSYSATMQWELEVAMNFKPSNQNHIRFHVYTDRSEVLDDEIDYFLQIGDNNHQISFRRQGKKSKTPEVLFKRVVDCLSNAVDIRLKLTLENRKTWSLYVYTQGGFELVGFCDKEVSFASTEGKVGLECRYTKTRANGFSFNYINVSHEISTETIEPEELPSLPQLIAVEALTRSSFQLGYDQPVDISEAVFTISDIGRANYQDYVDESYKQIEIRFEKELELGVEYEFSCAGIKDVQGNRITDISNRISVTYGDGTERPEEPEEPIIPEEPVRPSFPEGSIRINEVMADPPKNQPDLSETEYVELYNTTNESIDLTGWQFFYGDKPTILTQAILEADSYAVLYHKDQEKIEGHFGINMPLSDFPYHLSNSGKELTLLDPSGKTIDQIAYEKVKSGIAWERSEKGFHLSTDVRGGTPGAKNSEPGFAPEQPVEPENPNVPNDPVVPSAMHILPQEIIFNELLPNPQLGGNEYIELYNRSDREISLTGLAITTRKSDGSFSAYYPLSAITTKMNPGDYVLLSKDLEGVIPFYSIQNQDALFALKIPILANTSSTLVLFNCTDESVVDEVHYSDDWHSPSVKNEKGISLERIDPDKETQDPKNWTSASTTDGGGTPGYQNSQYGISLEEDATSIETPIYSDVSKGYSITYHLDQPGYACRALVFDMSGRQVSEVINYELLGIDGIIEWNGLSSNGNKVRTGVYIFYVELVHPEGKVFRSKKAFVVR